MLHPNAKIMSGNKVPTCLGYVHTKKMIKKLVTKKMRQLEILCTSIEIVENIYEAYTNLLPPLRQATFRAFRLKESQDHSKKRYT